MAALKQAMVMAQMGGGQHLQNAARLHQSSNRGYPGKIGALNPVLSGFAATVQERKAMEAAEEATKKEAELKALERQKKAKAAASLILAGGGTQKQADAAYDAINADMDLDLSSWMKKAEKKDARTANEKDLQMRMEFVKQNPDMFQDKQVMNDYILTGEINRPEPAKAEKPDFINVEDVDGSKHRVPVDPNTGKPVGDRVQTKPPEPEEGLEPISGMGSELKTKFALAKNAKEMFEKAVPVMFEGDEFRNVKAALPRGEVARAMKDYRAGLYNVIRYESGAAIPETEVEREVDTFMPSALDTDAEAMAKVERARNKIYNFYDVSSAGYDTSELDRDASVPTFNTPDEVRAAVEAGELKSGDKFRRADGQIGTVK
jgi:hypothetical protein